MTLVSRSLLGAGFGLVCVAGIASIFLALRSSDADQWISHSLEVQRDGARLLGDMQDAETSERGFVLTADAKYLEPLAQSETDAPTIFAELLQLTSDNPVQQERLKKLKPLLDAKFDVVRQTVALMKQGRRDDAQANIMSDRGRELMDSIRIELTAFSHEEADLLIMRQRVSSRLRFALLGLICISLFTALVLAGVLARSTQHALTSLRERTTELENESKLRRATEATLRQSQKMEAVGQLTGGIAHDFNNLLTVIQGNLDTVKRRLNDLSSFTDMPSLAATLLKPVDMALEGARNAAQLTHRLLAFSRQQMLEPTPVDLNRLISEMSNLLRRALGETINIETILAGGLWLTFADAGQIENALLNLSVNARDAMPEGGRLTIETANAYLDDAYVAQFGDVREGQYVSLSVTDTGVGIPDDVLGHVFEPFFTTKSVGQGTGLGLAMVHGFVKQSGGHIRIYTEIGHGTTVRIYLPRLIQAERTAAVPTAKISDLSPTPRAAPFETVMVVEDNAAVREYAKSALEELGYRVLGASDADEALNTLRTEARVDLLFTDVVLPGTNGRELANQARERRPNLVVLFTTGYTRNAIIHAGRLDPDVQLLSKPYTQQSLAKKVRELLDGKSV